MGDLRELFAGAVHRLHRDGRLAEGWPAGDYADRAVGSILAEVVAPSG